MSKTATATPTARSPARMKCFHHVARCVAGLCAGLALMVAVPAHAQSTMDELTAAVAATAVLAFRCDRPAFEAVRDQAFREMYQRLRLYSAADQMLAYEATERKMKAFSISSSERACPQGLERLLAMSDTWGFGHLVVPAARGATP